MKHTWIVVLWWCVALATHHAHADDSSPAFISEIDTFDSVVVVPSTTFNQSGRSDLLWASTLWSLTYYGLAVGNAIGDNDEYGAPTGGAVLLMGSAGFLVPYALTRNAEVPRGASSMAIGGMFQGALHGWMLGGLIFGDKLGFRTGWGMSAAVGITETVAGFLLAKQYGITEGEASLINSTMVFSTVSASLATLDAITETSSTSSDVRLLTGMGLAGAAGGLALANVIRERTRINNADAAVFTTTACILSLAPLAIWGTVSKTIEGSALRYSTMAAIAAGMLSGYLMIDGVDYPNDNSLYYPLGAVAGAAFGWGLSEVTRLGRATPVVMLAGAIGGFGIVLASESIMSEPGRLGSVDVNFNPIGMMLAVNSTVPIPIVAVQLRF
jgi:hypothetical protein